MSRRAAIILTVILAAVIIAAFLGAWLLARQARMPQTHLVPDGYAGWVEATYGVDGAPPLPIEDGKRIFRYDASGKLETSSEFLKGWGVDNYYYEKGQTREPLVQRPPGFEGQIWHVYSSSQTVSRIDGVTTRTGVRTGFFVGTEEQLRADPDYH